MLDTVTAAGLSTVRIDGLAQLRRQQPRAVVATVAEAPELIELHSDHERLMQRVGLDAERKYKPHVTLARLRDSSSRQVADYLSAREPFRWSRSGLALRALFLARLGRRRPLRG